MMPMGWICVTITETLSVWMFILHWSTRERAAPEWPHFSPEQRWVNTPSTETTKPLPEEDHLKQWKRHSKDIQKTFNVFKSACLRKNGHHCYVVAKASIAKAHKKRHQITIQEKNIKK